MATLPDLSPLNTLIQLSIGLNIACIAAFKMNQFGLIVESTVLQTTKKVEDRIDRYTAQIETSKVSLEVLTVDNNDDIILRRVTDLQTTHISLTDLMKNGKDDLFLKLEEKCTPKYMGVLCTYCLTIGTLSLFLILASLNYSFARSIFYTFTLLSILPLLYFTLIKICVDNIFYTKLNNPNVEDNKKTSFYCAKILKSLISFLRVKCAFYTGCTILLISIIISFIKILFVRTGLFLDQFLQIVEYIGAALPFSSFLIYFFVSSRYNKRRKKEIDLFFKPIEAGITTCNNTKSELDIYTKVKNGNGSEIDLQPNSVR